MGIYLPNMEMPRSCYKCPIRRRDGMDIVCPVAHERFSVADINILEYRLDNCPLIPVPKHGDLIDREWMRKAFYRYAKTGGVLYDLADEAPTIIPANKEVEQ